MMAPLAVHLAAETIEAYRHAAATLALAEPGADGPRLMARLVTALAGTDAGGFLADTPAPAATMSVLLLLTPEARADVQALANARHLQPAEVAARILTATAKDGPAAALVAVNCSRVPGRKRDTRR